MLSKRAALIRKKDSKERRNEETHFHKKNVAKDILKAQKKAQKEKARKQRKSDNAAKKKAAMRKTETTIPYPKKKTHHSVSYKGLDETAKRLRPAIKEMSLDGKTKQATVGSDPHDEDEILSSDVSEMPDLGIAADAGASEYSEDYEEVPFNELSDKEKIKKILLQEVGKSHGDILKEMN